MTPSTSAIGYAFTLGLIAALNPCGFPLLPAYLAFFVAAPTESGSVARTWRGIVAGFCVTAGFVVVFGAAGTLVMAGFHLVLVWAPWVMIAVGLGLVAAGVAVVAGRNLPVRLPSPRVGSGRGALAMVGYGIVYAVGSLGCSLPLFLAGIAETLTRTSPLAAASAFLAYALGMGVFVTSAGLIASHLGSAPLRSLRPLTRFLPKIGGILLLAVGGYLTYYWADDLVDPGGSSLLVTGVDRVQGAASGALSQWPILIGGILGVLLLAGFAYVARHGHSAGQITSTPASASQEGLPRAQDRP